jgi:hypothetical protein
MGAREDGPRAVVVLAQGDTEVCLGEVDPALRCDLGLVDDLLRMQHHAARLGWTLRIVEVRSDLRELFELVGLLDRLDGA